VRDGKVVKHRGDPDHPVTRGSLCLRGNRYLRRLYSEERVLHPMRRARGGGGAWQRISWDDALDLCAEELRRARGAHGPEAVMLVSYSGIKGQVARLLQRAFWAHFGGCTSVYGGTSVEAAVAAQEADFGQEGAHGMEDLANAAALVVWGKNIEVTRPHAWRFVLEARQAGAPLHVIDPVRCATARKADRHHQLRPGSDPWLALGLGRLLLERGAYDRDFVRDHTAGLEAYRTLVASVDLREVLDATDLPMQSLEELAGLYQGAHPLATLIGLGPAYWRGAGATVRLIDALAALSGNLGVSGGGAHTDTFAGYSGMVHELPGDPPRTARRKLALPRLGADMQAATDPPLRVGWIAGANPAATCPDTGAVDRALAGLDFLVVVDQFITASAAHAHLFLPCTTYLEMEDLVVAYGHNWLGVDQAVIPPEGEARSDMAIYQALARRLGFGEALEGEPAAWVDRILGPLASEHGVTFQRLRGGAVENPLARRIPFAGAGFPTPSGKVELIGELPDPLPRPDLSGGRLHLVATKTLKMVNAQMNPEDVPAEPVARLHPQALAARGLADGGRARVVSGAGQVEVRLRPDETLRPDMLLLNPAAWQGDLQGVNQLREAEMTDLGAAAAMHGTLVRVESR